MRQLSPSEYATMIALFRRLVRLCGGPRLASQVTDVNEKTVSDYGNPHTTSFPRLDVVADLEAECGVPVVTGELARWAGEAAPPTEAVEPFRFLAHLTAEIGELNAITIDAAADDHWTAAEYDDWLAKARDAKDLLQQQIDAVETGRARHGVTEFRRKSRATASR